jgi:hypothetical protein
MRKQDRIAQEQQNRQQSESRQESNTQPREREQVRGRASEEQKPQRAPGEKLPLPE